MKKIFLPLVLMLFAQATFAQQLSLNSQYMMNRFVLNPAIAGNYNHIPINFNIRKQWDGINGAPVTQSLSAHSYLGSNVGFGGYFFNDVTGPTRRTGMNLSFSYQLKLNSDFSRKLSFGLSGIFFQHFITLPERQVGNPIAMIDFTDAITPVPVPDNFFPGEKYGMARIVHMRGFGARSI